MITNRLKKLLLENNITIDYKISPTEFNEKKDFIINMYQSKGYEQIKDSLILFLGYFLNKSFLARGNYIDFTLEKVLTSNNKGHYFYIESCFDLKNLIPFAMVIIRWLLVKIIAFMRKGLSFYFMEEILLKLWKTCYKVIL